MALVMLLPADASRPTATNATTGTTALAATKVNPSCDEIPTLSHSPTCIDSNADFLDVGIESLVSLFDECEACLLYTSPSPRDGLLSRMPSSA